MCVLTFCNYNVVVRYLFSPPLKRISFNLRCFFMTLMKTRLVTIVECDYRALYDTLYDTPDINHTIYYIVHFIILRRERKSALENHLAKFALITFAIILEQLFCE